MSKINFFNQETDYQPANKAPLINWITDIINRESNKKIKTINYIFCTDDFLLDINRQYLKHDYLTDIITFDQSEDKKTIEADIFISIERVEENSVIAGETFEKELYRVMVHGLLHLLGFDDKSSEEKNRMREKENECLTLLQS